MKQFKLYINLINKIMSDEINAIAEVLVGITGGRYVDVNKIAWKLVNDKWIGKRSVWTYDFRACWLEDTTIENVKSWWCGEDADYSETFTRKQYINLKT
jgi:hypothetical protein